MSGECASSSAQVLLARHNGECCVERTHDAGGRGGERQGQGPPNSCARGQEPLMCGGDVAGQECGVGGAVTVHTHVGKTRTRTHTDTRTNGSKD